MGRLKGILTAAIVVSAQTVCASPSFAQGCILLRQTSPMFGTGGSPDQEVGTWNVTFTARNSTADKHYMSARLEFRTDSFGVGQRPMVVDVGAV